MDELVIKRVVPVPLYANGNSVLELLEIGSKLFSKDNIYQKFFELGYPHVKQMIIDEIIRKCNDPIKANQIFKRLEIEAHHKLNS